MTVAPIPPHPRLDRYYGSDSDRPAMVSDLFDEGAPYYEWICRVMSFGTGEQYRSRHLREAGLAPGMRVLDVATGTGLVLRAAVEMCGQGGLAIGLDPSRGMLGECRKGCAAPLLQGRGEHLPFADASFDMVSMGYGLRHVADLRALFGVPARAEARWTAAGSGNHSAAFCRGPLGESLLSADRRADRHTHRHEGRRSQSDDGLLLGHDRDLRAA